MEFTRIKYHNETMELEWEEKKKNDTQIVNFASHDEPEQSFLQALQAIGPLVCKLLGLHHDYVSELTVTTVSLKSGGCVITAQKKIEGFNSPFMIHTPHMKRENEGASTMPGDLAKAVDHLIEQAGRYVKGHRAQLSLIPAA